MEDWMEPAPGNNIALQGKVFLGYALKDDANNSIVLDWGTRYRIPDGDASRITLKAVWGNGVQVTFDANGGTFYNDDGEKDEEPREGCWVPGSKIKMDGWMVPEPSEDGPTKDKVFLGYAQNSVGGDVIFSWEDRFTVPNASTTLYAVWGNGVQVTFNANGGIFRNDDGVEEGTTREGNWMPDWKIEMEDWMEPAPGEKGKVFLGYALNDAANAPIVLDWGTRYKIPDSNPPSSITLYAVWGNGVQVTFNANGGCFGEDDGEGPETTRFGYWMPSWKIEMDDWMRPEPGEEGKVFLGFAPRNAADAPIVLDERTRYRIPDKDNEEITLFALWDDPNHSWGAPTYTWSADNSQVTAKHVCVNYTAHVEEETASTTAKITTPATCTAKGKTTYTAVFTNTAFASQTKVVENIDALGHNWGAWTKVSDATTSSPEQQRRICARCNAVETRSVGDKLPTPPAVVESPQVISPNITIPKVPASVKAKAAKNGKVTVSWKAIKKSKKTKALLAQIKGIEVQYSTDPTFATDVNTKNVGKKKTKVTLKLQKKTVYYIRVRYTDGAGGVSNWSAVKKVKTKK